MVAAEVFLWGTRIGYVTQEDYGSVPVFSYDKNFLTHRMEISPIVMPLSGRSYSFPENSKESFQHLPGLLADSLPDKFGNRLLDRYFEETGKDISRFSAVERLLYIGSRGMGALEYRPAMNLIRDEQSELQISSLVEVASDILTERKKINLIENEKLMEQIMAIGTSAGGARAKAVIAWNPETKSVRSGQITAGEGYQYWLIKFDGVKNNKDKETDPDHSGYTRVEYAYYKMAIDSGIEMKECILCEEADRFHFMTKRFDRTDDGKKIHMQSLGALAHYDYNIPGVNSYEQAANIVYRLGMGQNEVEQLYRRMIFNCLAKNYDDHVKNISFLMDKDGKWSLAPAYDVTYAYKKDSIWLSRHQMSIGGKLDNISQDDIICVGRTMNIKDERSKQILEQIYEITKKWISYAEESNVPEAYADRIQKEIRRIWISS